MQESANNVSLISLKVEKLSNQHIDWFQNSLFSVCGPH